MVIAYDIIIYCGGKCGSKTLLTTFKRNGYSTVHTHSIREFEKKKEQYGFSNIFELIDYSKEKKKIYIIDSYRTPIERKISSFFENIKKHKPDYKKTSINDLIKVFNNKYLNTLEEYHSINEVMEHYGVPKFTLFDFEKGYNIIEKNNLIFIKVLFIDIDKWNEVFSKIFGKKIKMYNDNLTKNKRIYNLYNIFKKNYRVSKYYLENVLVNDEEFKIYNTIKEQKEYVKKYYLLL